jgi:hypothetical protein
MKSHCPESKLNGPGIAFPKSRLEPKMVQGSKFKYQKVFGEGQFIAAGVVYIPVGGNKPGKFSRDNSYVSASYPANSNLADNVTGLLCDCWSGRGPGAPNRLRHGPRCNVHGAQG